MEALRKITTINNGVITFNELNKYNHQKVEVIVLPIYNKEKKITKSQKKNLLKFDGIINSEENDTSLKVDELIYGK